MSTLFGPGLAVLRLCTSVMQNNPHELTKVATGACVIYACPDRTLSRAMPCPWYGFRWEVQLMIMNLISRIIAIHELIVMNFYPYLEKYLWPMKQDVTLVLTYIAQACHEDVPPECMESVLLKIANNFVSEKSSPEVMAVG